MDKNIINSILDNFASSGKVFSNEQDFQFEFAKALENLDEVEYARLEPLSLEIEWEELQRRADNKEKLEASIKEYTDIIVKLSDGTYIAFELKYKTPNKICYYETTGSGRVVTMVQGAHFISAYQYLQDISRLENINVRHFPDGMRISKSYAIMLSNNKDLRYNDFHRSETWKNYGINDNKTIGPGKIKFIKNPDEYKTPEGRNFKAITLNNSYELLWKNYQLHSYVDYRDRSNSVHPGFSYLVVEVTPTI